METQKLSFVSCLGLKVFLFLAKLQHVFVEKWFIAFDWIYLETLETRNILNVMFGIPK